MKQAFYADMPYVPLALLAFALFAAIFSAALVRLFTRRPDELQDLAALPFDDRSTHETTP